MENIALKDSLIEKSSTWNVVECISVKKYDDIYSLAINLTDQKQFMLMPKQLSARS